jgi:hypothetical protein
MIVAEIKMNFNFDIRKNVNNNETEYLVTLDKEALDALVDAFDVALVNMNLLSDNSMAGRLVKADLFKRCKNLESIINTIKTTLNRLSDKVKR